MLMQGFRHRLIALEQVAADTARASIGEWGPHVQRSFIGSCWLEYQQATNPHLDDRFIYPFLEEEFSEPGVRIIRAIYDPLPDVQLNGVLRHTWVGLSVVYQLTVQSADKLGLFEFVDGQGRLADAALSQEGVNPNYDGGVILPPSAVEAGLVSYLSFICVLLPYQGRGRGEGQRLHIPAEDPTVSEYLNQDWLRHAAATGCKYAVVRTRVDCQPLLHVYGKDRFVIVGRRSVKQHGFDGSPRVVLVKKLD